MIPPLRPGNKAALTEYDHNDACDDCQLREAQAEQAARRHLLRSTQSESATVALADQQCHQRLAVLTASPFAPAAAFVRRRPACMWQGAALPSGSRL